MKVHNFSRELATEMRRLGNADLDGVMRYATEGQTREQMAGELERYRRMVRLHHKSQKFILPPGGRLMDDQSMTDALMDGVEHLPFKYLCVEYEVPQTTKFPVDSGTVPTRKRLAYAVDHEEIGTIEIIVAYKRDDSKYWTVLNSIYLNKKQFMYIDDNQQFRWVMVKTSEEHPDSDYADEVSSFMCFLAATTCSNIKKKTILPLNYSKKLGKGVSPAKGVLPYDSYHYLVVDTAHRVEQSHDEEPDVITEGGDRFRPREHVRTGHYRTYRSGLRVWINERTINKGIGHKVDKTYVIKA